MIDLLEICFVFLESYLRGVYIRRSHAVVATSPRRLYIFGGGSGLGFFRRFVC